MKWIRVCWLIACSVVLILWLSRFVQSAGESAALQSELHLLLVWPMLFLTLPAGLLWAFVLQGAVLLLGTVGIGNGEIGAGLLVLFWTGATLLGYLQWFVALPSLWRRWNAKRGSTSSSNSEF